MKKKTLQPAPAVLNWEVWRRKLRAERTPGTIQFIRKFYLIARYATRAEANKRVNAEMKGGLYIPSDLRIANLDVGINRPPYKSRAPNQTPETRHIKRMPWETEPRRNPEATALKRRIKAAEYKPEKPPRTVVVDGTVFEMPTGVRRATDFYTARWVFTSPQERKSFTDSKYGGAQEALQACKDHITKRKEALSEIPKTGKRR